MDESSLPSYRSTYENAARYFLATVEAVRADQWAAPGLGQWSVRDLVGHTSRGLETIEIYADQPADGIDVDVPVGYFLTMLDGARTTPAEVLERGRAAGAALGADPAGAIRELAERALARAASLADDALFGTPAGGMRFRDYLPTRTFELTVHTLDLASAIGLTTDPPADALRQSLAIACELAIRRGSGATLLHAVTGRRDLPSGFSVV